LWPRAADWWDAGTGDVAAAEALRKSRVLKLDRFVRDHLGGPKRASELKPAPVTRQHRYAGDQIKNGVGEGRRDDVSSESGT
jgi:hypothetical protein